MRVQDYPPQEPLSDFARPYSDEVLRQGRAIDGVEAKYGEDAYQSIAVFAAEEPSGDVLMFMHGGGWTNGYKEWMSFMAPALTARGVTFASAGYRLAPSHVFPSGFDDSIDAVAWLHANVADHGGDPKRLYVGGHSAGGHYAALMAVRRDVWGPRGLPDDVIRGCLPVSGVYDFLEGSGLSARPRFLGPEDSGHETAASPILNIQGTPPPFLMAWGEADFPHLIRQAERMRAALAAAGGEASTLVLAGCDHLQASLAAGDASRPWVETAVRWMRDH